MLAGIAAAAQGRPVAEVCDVYGVKTITTGIRPDGFTPELVGAAMHGPESTDSGEQAMRGGLPGHVHGPHHQHAAESRHPAPNDARESLTPVHADAQAALTTSAALSGHAPGPAHAAAHGSDHCALTGWVAFATDPPKVAPMLAAGVLANCTPTASIAPHDAAARWATLLGHGPPAVS